MTMIHLTTRAENILDMARAIAESRGHKAVGVEHIQLAILDEDDSMAAAAIRATSSAQAIRAFLDKNMQVVGDSVPPEEPPITR